MSNNTQIAERNRTRGHSVGLGTNTNLVAMINNQDITRPSGEFYFTLST